MPPDLRVHVGVAAVVEHDGHLLMVQRGGVGPFAADGHGTWSVPGGWLDYGETPHEAAAREALEETGVTVEPVCDAGFINATSEPTAGDFQIITLFVRCAYVSGEPVVTEPDKCPAVHWVPVSRVADRPLFAPLAAWWPASRMRTMKAPDG